MRTIYIILEDNPNYPLWGEGCYHVIISDTKEHFSEVIEFPYDEGDIKSQVTAFNSANLQIEKSKLIIEKLLTGFEDFSFTYNLIKEGEKP